MKMAIAAMVFALPTAASAETVPLDTAEEIMMCIEYLGDMIEHRSDERTWRLVTAGDGRATWVDRRTGKNYERIGCDVQGRVVTNRWTKR
jgi:hypothetical protein